MSATVITMIVLMVRWEADGRDRLQKAALELYTERGFDETTVAEIAQAAGLTERTFFRHFADKREVIFGGQEAFQERFTTDIATAPPDAAPLDIIGSAVLAGSEFFTMERRPHSLRRQAVIAAHPELRERDLLKMASLAGALADALRARGVPEPSATLAAESGVVVFRVAWDQWLTDGNTRSLVDIEREAFQQLAALTERG